LVAQPLAFSPSTGAASSTCRALHHPTRGWQPSASRQNTSWSGPSIFAIRPSLWQLGTANQHALQAPRQDVRNVVLLLCTIGGERSSSLARLTLALPFVDGVPRDVGRVREDDLHAHVQALSARHLLKKRLSCVRVCARCVCAARVRARVRTNLIRTGSLISTPKTANIRPERRTSRTSLLFGRPPAHVTLM
jgi:hypothetical protein